MRAAAPQQCGSYTPIIDLCRMKNKNQVSLILGAVWKTKAGKTVTVGELYEALNCCINCKCYVIKNDCGRSHSISANIHQESKSCIHTLDERNRSRSRDWEVSWALSYISLRCSRTRNKILDIVRLRNGSQSLVLIYRCWSTVLQGSVYSFLIGLLS